MKLLYEVLESADPLKLESLFSRLPNMFNIVILSIHGYFGQADVLGLLDTRGQVVYILDQVRALEEEPLHKIELHILDVKPQILVAWVTLGRAQLNFGEPDNAIESFDRALALKETMFLDTLFNSEFLGSLELEHCNPEI
ncbi:hypothetical protein JHK82_055696 [Glycine max]|nr:hypothetical protein JHK82_055696 [Glycine max]